MACILKFPSSQSKGIVTLTTQEWREVKSTPNLLHGFERLRTKFVTGLHFNWHDYKFDPPSQFDFFMAGEHDLRPVNNKAYRLLPLDACNFTPSAYEPTALHGKYWDVLIVGNPVYFKRPELVLQTIRGLYDQSKESLRVLYICPIPKYNFLDEDTVLYHVRDYYESLFTLEERKHFTLLTTTFDSPNPFDRETLSIFFKNSKVFLHCATEERRCRIAAYAWCSGLPVVAYPSVASILPQQLQRPPGFFEIDNDNNYVKGILDALASLSQLDPKAYRRELSEVYTIEKLQDFLKAIFCDLGISFEGSLLGQNLDRRLGWHHQSIGGVSNGLEQSLAGFMNELMNFESIEPNKMESIKSNPYPERILANEHENAFSQSRDKVVSRSIYLNPKKRKWMRILKLVKMRILN